jgi:hypothetical protein
MLISEIRNMLIVFLVLSPIFIILSNYSLKYHAAKYHISPQTVQIFLESLPVIAKFIFSQNGFFYDRPKYSPEQIAASLQTQRIMVSVLPLLFIVASIFQLIQLVPKGNMLIIRYTIVPIVLAVVLWRVWKFGDKLKDLETKLD